MAPLIFASLCACPKAFSFRIQGAHDRKCSQPFNQPLLPRRPPGEVRMPGTDRWVWVWIPPPISLVEAEGCGEDRCSNPCLPYASTCRHIRTGTLPACPLILSLPAFNLLVVGWPSGWLSLHLPKLTENLLRDMLGMGEGAVGRKCSLHSALEGLLPPHPSPLPLTNSLQSVNAHATCHLSFCSGSFGLDVPSTHHLPA